MAAGREPAVLGGTLQWAAFEGRKLGILALAFALRRFSVSLYLFLIHTVH